MSAISECPPRPLSTSQTALKRLLLSSPYWSVRQLACHADQNRTIVRGTVPTYYMKQVAQSLVSKAVGLGCVEYDIEVR